MDVSLLSLVVFSIITFMYFSFIKPPLTLDLLQNNAEGLNSYYSSTYSTLGIYLLLILVTQLGLNISYLATKCGGSMSKNVVIALIYTFIPWLLMFGILIAVLLMFPGFKSVFSDVIGYYVVYSSANNIFSKILIDTSINDAMKTSDETTKKEMQSAAELIMKMVGNKSVLINELNPDNFMNIWDTLKPLMVGNYYNDEVIKQELLDLVVLKDNIGEGLWYLYTGILISSIVYYNLSSSGCVKDVATLKQEQEDYLKKQEEIEAQKAKMNEVKYTM
jgi:UPF0716 family protein affecting phage T7 exclusion